MNLLQGRRLIDLSVTLDNNPWTDPPPLLPKKAGRAAVAGDAARPAGYPGGRAGGAWLRSGEGDVFRGGW